MMITPSAGTGMVGARSSATSVDDTVWRTLARAVYPVRSKASPASSLQVKDRLRVSPEYASRFVPAIPSGSSLFLAIWQGYYHSEKVISACVDGNGLNSSSPVGCIAAPSHRTCGQIVAGNVIDADALPDVELIYVSSIPLGPPA